ncbi:pyridoxal phosphate-dependent decarboxylase family protein [Chitinophaga nivalis]|uniref:Aspartate aminotransferase family protein n=1 Tax=Chitinophaga nivalis TaxID=2991709 RepID=A0ABT3ILB9_9BACT|nr:aspartate aminotransferase family protein [Chitinophaga nivalis]MCW3465770.1 aspartate aminotransferase family protein [Chitinophaga nivalis]MCW3484539.1 aspartate aminotransferase family protein [Chitinophaga nivalis]
MQLHISQPTPVTAPYKDIFREETTGEYLSAIQLASESVARFLGNNKKPFSGVTPADLKPFFSTVDLNTPLADYQSLLQEVETIYSDHAIAFHLPQYIAHLNCPVVIPAIAAEVLISAINSSLDTWDQSAGGTLIEQKLIEWTCREIGFGPDADGIFTSGGTQSNLMALLLARDHYAVHHLHHNIKKDGLPAEATRFRIFTSEISHFSIQKNASLLGLGEQAVVKVRSDQFRMDMHALEDAIRLELQKGNIPIAIVATAGNTDFGNIDSLETAGRLAAQYKLWFHVDAAYGCGLLLSNQYRHLLNGIELADSVTTDYHKSFFQPVSSSSFLVKNKATLGLLKYHADYLNPKEQEEDGLPNQVSKSLQTTRRFDALKLWFTMRLMGKQQLGEYFDTLINTTAAVATILEEDPDFELLNYSDISALVFRYNPESNFQTSACSMNQHIRKAMLEQGEALVAGTKVQGAYYLKFTILNPLTTTDHVLGVMDIIRQHGEAWLQTQPVVLENACD